MTELETKDDEADQNARADRANENNYTNDNSGAIIFETGPLLWPVIFVIGVTVVLTVILIGAIYFNPELVGGATFGEVIINAILILALVILGRYIIKLIILKRTTYTIYDDGFKMEYEVFYRKLERELPVEQLRGKEYDRSRVESLYGCATIRLLTGGTDQSLGFIEFESVREPRKVLHMISEVQDNQGDVDGK